jgi:hypothetical protein
MPRPHPIDHTLAFTALLELDPAFGKMPDAEATKLREELLDSYYASDSPNIREHTKGFVVQRRAAATQHAQGFVQESQRPAESPAGLTEHHAPLDIAAKPMRGEWDEPAGAVSPRGWLMQDGTCVGNYLDYGPDHYRSPHEYCRPDDLCRECQPGNVHAVRYPGGPGTDHESRYFGTPEEARQFVEHGQQPLAVAEGGVCCEPGANGGKCGLEAEHQGDHRPVHAIHPGERDTGPDGHQQQEWAEHDAHTDGLVPSVNPDDQRQLLP